MRKLFFTAGVATLAIAASVSAAPGGHGGRQDNRERVQRSSDRQAARQEIERVHPAAPTQKDADARGRCASAPREDILSEMSYLGYSSVTTKRRPQSAPPAGDST